MHDNQQLPQKRQSLNASQQFPRIHNERILRQKKNLLEIQIEQDAKLYNSRVKSKLQEQNHKFRPSYSVIQLDNYKNYQLFSKEKFKPDQIERKMNQLFKRKAILDQNWNEKIVKHNNTSMKTLFNSNSIEKILMKNDYSLPPINNGIDSFQDDYQMDENSIEYMLSRKRNSNNDSVQFSHSQLHRCINLDNEKNIDSDETRMLLDNNIKIHKIIKSLLTYGDKKEEIQYDSVERRHQQMDFDKKNSVEQFQYLIEVTDKIINNTNENRVNDQEMIVVTDRSNTLEASLMQPPPPTITRDFILLIGLKEFYTYFKHQQTEIVDRILLSLDINPYNDLSKVSWTQFLSVKRVILEKTASLNEKVKFIVQFVMGQKNNKDTNRIDIQQVLRVFRLLFRKNQDTNCQQLTQLVTNNIEMSLYLDVNNTISVLNLKQLFLQNYLKIQDFISLFQL